MINYWTCDFVYCIYILLNVFWAKNNVFVCVCVSLNNHLNPNTTSHYCYFRNSVFSKRYGNGNIPAVEEFTLGLLVDISSSSLCTVFVSS